MRYEILRLGPVVVVLLFIAGVFLWFWLDERRFAAQLDRRFAPYKTQPKEREEREEPKPLKAYLDWVNWREELERRVTALEERTGMLEEIENQIHSINPPLRGLSSPDSSPDTETQADPQSLSNTLSPSLSVKVDGR